MPKQIDPDDAVRLFDDKLAMRELLAARGVSTVRYTRVDSLGEMRAAMAKFGYPAVVKPTSLSGGRGVYLLTRPQHLSGWAALLQRYDYGGPFLVEEYLRGPQFRVETMSRDGAHEVIGVATKELSLPPLFVDMGHAYPAPLPAERSRAIADSVIQALAACGYRNGPAVTDVVWTSSGPAIVGTRARREGDDVTRLATLAGGIDAARAIFSALVGEPQTLHPGCSTAAISYFWLPCGEVESVSGLDQIRALDYVEELAFPFSPGDRVAETMDAKSRHGHVIVTADSATQAAQRIAEVRRLLTVTLRPRPAFAVPAQPRSTPASSDR